MYKGGELLDEMALRENLPEIDCLKITRNIQTGLAYQESKGIIHRDIKPPNIVLRNEDNIFDQVLVDFGFGLKTSDVDRKNKKQAFCVGTPGYMAPEMLKGMHYDTRADVFSTGSTLYLMMVYEPPFYSKDKAQILAANKEGKQDFDFNEWEDCNYDYSEETQDLLQKMMSVDPEFRPLASECLKHKAFELIPKDEPEVVNQQVQKRSSVYPIQKCIILRSYQHH